MSSTAKIQASRTDILKVEAMLKDIKGGANLALARAINQGVSTGKTQAVKSIGQYLNLKAARIKKDFAIKKAKKTDLTGYVSATGKPVGLLNFGARATKKGYSVKVKRKGSRKLLKHSFKAKTRKARKDGSNYETEHLWWRKGYGGARTGTDTKYAGYFASLPADHYLKRPLHRLSGPRIEDVFAKSGIYDPVQAVAAEKTNQKLMSEAERILSRHG